MKHSILCIASCRNEADFLPHFLEFNSHYISKFVILDGSDDRFLEVIEYFRSISLDIEVHQESGIWTQSDFVNRIIKEQGNRFDFIFPLDIDEIVVDSRDTFFDDISSLPRGHVGTLNWSTFAPMRLLTVGSDNLAPHKDFLPFTNDISVVQKVIIPGYMSNLCYVTNGSHVAFVNWGGIRKRIAETPISARLGHFPVRSEPQLLSKLIPKWLNFKRLPAGEGLFLPHAIKRLTGTSLPLALEDLHVFSYFYSVGTGIPPPEGFSILSKNPLRDKANLTKRFRKEEQEFYVSLLREFSRSLASI